MKLLRYLPLLFFFLCCSGPDKSANENKADTGQTTADTAEYGDTDGGDEQENDSDSLLLFFDQVQKLVYDWNDRINEQKLQELKDMYTSNVHYYTKTISADECITSKEKWLTAHPGYHQEIVELELFFPNENNWPVASFQKVFVDKDTQKVESLLFFAKVNDQWKIMKETDLISEVVNAKKMPLTALSDGEHSFVRTIWRDARDEGMVTKYSKLEYTLNIRIKSGEVSGEMTRYSRSLGGIEVYIITSGKIDNGMLEFTTEWEQHPSAKETLHFKIAHENRVVCTDKEQMELFGQPMVRFKR
jgi:hypothetical protein